MAKFTRKRNVNIGRVVTKIAVTLVALYAGGIILTALGTVMNGTGSPFYTGLSLIGWTVGTTATNGTAGYFSTTCAGGASAVYSSSSTLYASDCVTNTSGTGILAVVGVIGLASIVMEFVDIRM